MNTPLDKRIGKLWAIPADYSSFPNPIIYHSKYGYKRASCPIKGCKYDGLGAGFNQHYARTHAQAYYRQKAKRIVKVFRGVAA
jgi:hypothetical protein